MPKFGCKPVYKTQNNCPTPTINTRPPRIGQIDCLEELASQEFGNQLDVFVKSIGDLTPQDTAVQTDIPLTVYSSSKDIITPKYFVDRANIQMKATLGCSLDDDEYLELFRRALSEFIVDGLNNKFNFLLVSQPLKLEMDKDAYTIPSNFHTHSNLFVNKKCCLWEKHRRFTFVPFESFSEETAYYTYTINNFNLLIKIPPEDCRVACESCTLNEENPLFFEYYHSPDSPRTLESPMYWLPNHNSVKDYILAIFLEVLYEYQGRPYTSAQKALLRKSVLEFATGINNKDSTKRIGKQFIKFCKY